MKLVNTYFSSHLAYLWLVYEDTTYAQSNKVDDEEYEQLQEGWLSIGDFNNVLAGKAHNDKLIRIERGDNASN